MKRLSVFFAVLLSAAVIFSCGGGTGGGTGDAGGTIGENGDTGGTGGENGDTGGTGGGNGDVVTYKYFAYILNDGNVSTYTMDYAAGTLSTSAVDYPVPDGRPWAIVKHPSKPYLYITSGTYDTHFVRVLSIAPATGGLTEIQHIATKGYDEIEITPDGNCLYTSGSGYITCYKVSEDGKLTSVGVDYNYPNHIRISPDGKVLYATYNYQVLGSSSSYDARYLAAFDINSDGTLAKRNSIDYTDAPYNIAVSGQFVYTTVSNKIYQYNGGASLVPNGDISSAGSYLGPIIAKRDFLYAAKPNTGKIVRFAINASTGSLTELESYATGTTSYYSKLNIDSDGKYLYAVDKDNKALLVYSIASDGGLTKLNWNVQGAPYSAVIAKVQQ